MLFKTLVISAASLTVLAPALFTTPVSLAPGGTVTTFTPTTSSFTGTEVAAYSATFSNAYENGSVHEDVYNNSGALDFYYQIVNNASSADDIMRVTVGLYTGFTTAVDYLLNGAVAPSSANRQAAGDSVGFYIGLAPGETTDWLEVATDASFYAPGTIALIDTHTTSLGGFGPAVPEPRPLRLLSAGLLLIGIARLRVLQKARISPPGA